ncbi:CBS domain-containing protein [Saccharopolyspora pogona]|uniref:CBS domain-containing protein n=1 Tax=Saccharopolyspora pogona TaxID=333966 RepID=UPI0016878E0A|nr:CBS domain-containing protein [Saccharopolyspora pogona]
MSDTQQPEQQQLLALKGATVRVADLLALFGVRYRNHQSVPMIMAALREAGLDTIPSFATCSNNAEMLVVAEEAAVVADYEQSEELLPGTLPQHSFKIGDIPSARNGVDSVASNASLARATHMMRTKNYSQLPVIDGISDLRGVITWSSVAAKYETGAVLTLASAMVTDSIPVAEVHQELFAHLPEVTKHGYLLVRSNSGRFTGIVTAADITVRFETTALPFFLVGEIEFQLRKCLGAKLPADAIREVQTRQPKEQRTGDVADLQFGDYVKLLKADQKTSTACANADSNWRALGWSGVDRTQFVHQLDRVREIRNKIAHFDSEPLTPQRIGELREFAGLLKQLV